MHNHDHLLALKHSLEDVLHFHPFTRTIVRNQSRSIFEVIHNLPTRTVTSRLKS